VRLKALAELVRLPNVFTAPADVAMGLAASGVAFDARLWPLFGASMCAYAGGMALNDACDAELDAVERPGRPIPSGRVPRVIAFALAALLLGAALGLAALAGGRALAVAGALILCIILYDTAARRTPAGPWVMAGCRVLDAGLGVAVGDFGVQALGPMVLLFLYVHTITTVSRFEVTSGSPAPARATRDAAFSFAVVVGVGAVALIRRGGLDGLPLLGLLAAWLAGPVRNAMIDPAPRRVIGVIKAAVLGIIFLDAAFVGGAWGLGAGLAVAALFVPAYILGRRFSSA
jgi:4-hydroxybenzoate polyprenyltransferase